MNLLLNAVEAIGSEGALTVRTGLAAGDPGTKEGGRKPNYLRVESLTPGAGLPRRESVPFSIHSSRPNPRERASAWLSRAALWRNTRRDPRQQPARQRHHLHRAAAGDRPPKRQWLMPGRAHAQASISLARRGSTVDATRAEAGAHVGGVLPKLLERGWLSRSNSALAKPSAFRATLPQPHCCGWDTRAPFPSGNTPRALHPERRY